MNTFTLKRKEIQTGTLVVCLLCSPMLVSAQSTGFSISPIVKRGDPIGDTDTFLRSMEQYSELGIDLVELNPPAPDPLGFVNQVGEKIVPRLSLMD